MSDEARERASRKFKGVPRPPETLTRIRAAVAARSPEAKANILAALRAPRPQYAGAGNPKRRHDIDTDRDIRPLVERGLRLGEIANAIGCSSTFVRQRLTAAGLVLSPAPKPVVEAPPPAPRPPRGPSPLRGRPRPVEVREKIGAAHRGRKQPATAGAGNPKYDVSIDTVRDIIPLVEQGLSQVEIARRLGKDRLFVYRRLKALSPLESSTSCQQNRWASESLSGPEASPSS